MKTPDITAAKNLIGLGRHYRIATLNNIVLPNLGVSVRVEDHLNSRGNRLYALFRGEQKKSKWFPTLKSMVGYIEDEDAMQRLRGYPLKAPKPTPEQKAWSKQRYRGYESLEKLFTGSDKQAWKALLREKWITKLTRMNLKVHSLKTGIPLKQLEDEYIAHCDVRAVGKLTPSQERYIRRSELARIAPLAAARSSNSVERGGGITHGRA